MSLFSRIATTVLLALPVSAMAAVMNYSLTATYGTVSTTSLGSHSNVEVTFNFSLDSASPDLDGSATVGFFAYEDALGTDALLGGDIDILIPSLTGSTLHFHTGFPFYVSQEITGSQARFGLGNGNTGQNITFGWDISQFTFDPNTLVDLSSAPTPTLWLGTGFNLPLDGGDSFSVSGTPTNISLSSSSASASSVPLPGALGLMLLGLAGLWRRQQPAA